MIDPEKTDSKRGWIEQLLTHPLIIATYYFAVLVGAVVYDQLTDTLPRETLIAMTAAGGAVFCISILVTAIAFRLSRRHEIDSRIAQLKHFIQAQNLGWIVNDRYIRGIEEGSTDTWVFTRRLQNDLREGGEIIEAVRSNLSKGHRYIYFVPDNPISHQCIHRYCRLHDFRPGQVQFYLVPEDRFLFYTEVVVYNVHGDTQKAIEWLPYVPKAAEGQTGEPDQYYILMGEDHAAYVVGVGEMFRNLLQPALDRDVA
jgi:hypothetical protein